MDAEWAEAMGKAFTAANPGIRVEVVRVTGRVAVQRLPIAADRAVNGSVMVVFPPAIPTGAPHPAAAKVASRDPFRTGVAPRKGVPEIIENWRDMLGMGIPTYNRLIDAKKNC
jgi:hypothetical protein